MHLVELAHELAPENDDPGAHRHKVDRQYVLHDECKNRDKDIEELFWDFIVRLAHCFHLQVVLIRECHFSF